MCTEEDELIVWDGQHSKLVSLELGMGTCLSLLEGVIVGY